MKLHALITLLKLQVQSGYFFIVAYGYIVSRKKNIGYCLQAFGLLQIEGLFYIFNKKLPIQPRNTLNLNISHIRLIQFFPKNQHTLNPVVYSISNPKFQFYKNPSCVASLTIDKFKLKNYIKLKIKKSLIYIYIYIYIYIPLFQLHFYVVQKYIH